MITYADFIETKRQLASGSGFEPLWIPEWMFDFQAYLTTWAIRKGRSALFADCGLGKTPMQLVWAQNVVQHTNGRVLVLTPLAVSHQTEREAVKFGIDAKRSGDGNPCASIVITNYERLHLFDDADYVGIVCDESSILKSVTGATRKLITRFSNKMRYRLLCTATPSPNDYVELGTSSEALGELSHSDMLKRFFKQLDDKGQKQESRLQDQAEKIIASDPSYFQKLSYRVAQTIGQWRLKHHAVTPFWRWVCSWARACRKPSDIGFQNDGFNLPPLIVNDHIIEAKPPEDMLFNVPAFGMSEERAERRRSLTERCELAAKLVSHNRPSVVWCHMNDEGDKLEEVLPDAKQICGSMEDDEKVELYEAFTSGQLRVLVIKPKIGAWGLNWQHCSDIVTFPTHSYEQYKQSIARCHRFGQTRPVRVDVIATSGELRVIGNMRKKADKADAMFVALVREMNRAESVERINQFTNKTELPSWL